jgi:hypothetical protein
LYIPKTFGLKVRTRKKSLVLNVM